VVGGTIAGRSDPSFVLVVLGEERLLFYGQDLPTIPRLSGFVFAANPGGSCSSNDPVTYNGRDRNVALNSTSKVYLYAPVRTTPPALTGSIRYPNATYALTGGSIAGSSYDTTATPTVADAAGSWAMTGLDGTKSTLTVDNAGAMTGSDRGCAFTGTASVRSGETANVLRVRLSVPPCDAQRIELPYEGFALVVPLAAGGARLLLWAQGSNGLDAVEVAAIGSRN
jgi:hypothetical protein